MKDIQQRIAGLTPAKRRLLEQRLAEQAVTKTPIPQRPEGSGPAPLSFGQQRIWFVQHLLEEVPLFNQTNLFRLHGRLDKEALRWALSAFIKRHETLRTTFHLRPDGRLEQVVAQEYSFELPLVRLTDAGDPEEELLRLARSVAEKPFDLSQDLLLRGLLFDLGQGSFALLLVHHHIASDYRSAGIFKRELGSLYAAEMAGEQAAFDPLPIRYRDFAAWQRKQAEEDFLQEQLAYWRQKLPAPLPVLSLPTDQPHFAASSYNAQNHELALSEELVARLSKLAQSERATLFMIMLAAYAVLLNRYSRQEDIIVGTILDGRTRREMVPLFGHFINLLPLPVALSPDQSFRELLRQVREMAGEAYANQDLPFETMVEAVQLERELDRAPIFQTMLNFLDVPEESLLLEGLEVEKIPFDLSYSEYDLYLTVIRRAEGLLCRFTAKSDLFTGETVSRMSQYFAVILESIVEQPDQTIGRLPLMTPAETQQILYEWNETVSTFPPPACVHQLFKEQAALIPEATAVTFADQHLSYAELNRKANQLAHFLQKQGAGPETAVAISMKRHPELIIGLLGILKAGAVYLPLDPDYPVERLAFMLHDAQAPILLTATPAADSLPLYDGQIIYLDQDWPQISQEADTEPPCAATPWNAAYIIYTSGSTGLPKGTVLLHRGVYNLALTQRHTFNIQTNTRVLQFASISYDASVWEMFMALANGGTLCLANEEVFKNPAEMQKFLLDQKINVATLTPTFLAEMKAVARSPFPDLRIVIAAGEPCSAQLVKLWTPGRQFYNAYGPTETTVCASMALCDPKEPRTPSIGRPIDNAKIYILDDQQQPVPVGILGELYISGILVGRGYLNRPELTKAHFLNDPFAENAGETMYRSGDMARWRADGTIEFLGRSDFQVKLRGQRIELNEIQLILGDHPGVHQNIVKLVKRNNGQQDLVSYYVPQEESLSAAQMRDYLSQFLPRHMVPSSFVPLKSLPLTASGKVDRRALPDIDRLVPNRAAELIPPRSPEEEMLCEIWMAVLNLEQVGIHDNFFDLGGHSLLAARVMSQVARLFEIESSVRILFEHPTVSDLAAQVAVQRRHKLDGHWYSYRPIPHQDKRTGGSPLSFEQERLWFLEQLNPGQINFILNRVLRLSGPLNVAALEFSLQNLIRRHEILRTVYDVEEGRLRQFVRQLPAAELMLHYDLSGLPVDEKEPAAEQIIAREAARNFDLTQDLMLRLALIHFGQSEFIISLTIHHIAIDHWSWSTLMSDLAKFYSAYDEDLPPDLLRLPITYGDYAIWQQEWFASPAADRLKEYWQKQLKDTPSLTLPADKKRLIEGARQAGKMTILVPAELTDAVQALSREEGATLFMTLLAVLQLLLVRLTGFEDIAVGTPVANRSRSEIESILGITLNTLVLRTDLSGNPTFRELLARVHQVTLEAYDHQELPFEAILQLVQPERELSQTPLFQVFLNYWPLPEPELTLGSIPLQLQPPASNEVNFDLTLYARHEADELQLTAVFNSDLFDAQRIEDILEQYKFLLTQVTQDPASSICAYSLVTETMRRRLPDPEKLLDSTWQGSIQDRLAYWADREPKNTAVVSNDGSWTYGQLEQIVNKLTGDLQEAGIGHGDIVAIYAALRPELVASILAVFRAGAAYTILSPDYPEERLFTYLQQAKPKAWIDCAAGGDQLFERWSQPGCFRLSVLHQGIIEKSVPARPAINVGPDDLAVITFTSGSTGQPKGVLGRHGSLTHFLPWQADAYQLNQADRFSMLSGLAHDPLQRDIFTSIWVGGTLHIPDDEIFDHPGHLLQWLHDQQITFAHLTPPMLRYIVTGANQRIKLFDLRYAFFTGDQLAAFVIEKLRSIAPQVTAINSYGTTETQRAVGVCLVPPDMSLNDQQAALPVGSGIPDAQLLILNQAGDLAGVGELGEICLRSPHLALGYLDDESLTAKRFGPNPWADQSWDRFYHTGDFGRYRPDGNIQVLERNDRQVKIRGFRVELAEVENRLSHYPAVKDCYATAQETSSGDRQLVAFYISSEVLLSGELFDFMRQRLPDFMVPTNFVRLEILPLTPNGKVDTAALPAPTSTRSDQAGQFASPQNRIEEVLCDIWTEVLEVDKVGVHDSFFDLGGYSLLGILLFARIEAHFGRRLPINTLFKAPTVAQLAAILALSNGDKLWDVLVPIHASGSRPPFFCVHGFGGGVIGYADLARLLGSDQPFYGLQATGLDGITQPDKTIESMAARYIQAMKTIQREGPYRIGGYCLGGVVAYEMARQLEAQGESTALVAIFEGYAPAKYHGRIPFIHPRRLLTVWQSVPYWLQDYSQYSAKQFRRSLRVKSQRIWNRLRPRLSEKAVAATINVDLDQLDPYHQKLIVIHIQALRRYTAGPLNSRVVLFRSRQQSISKTVFGALDPAYGWEHLVRGDVEVRTIAGAHRNIHMMPHVISLATELDDCLNALNS